MAFLTFIHTSPIYANLNCFLGAKAPLEIALVHESMRASVRPSVWGQKLVWYQMISDDVTCDVTWDM